MYLPCASTFLVQLFTAYWLHKGICSFYDLRHFMFRCIAGNKFKINELLLHYGCA